MKQKGNSKTRETQKITANEPSNIFEYNKPAKVVDFNKLVSKQPSNKSKLKIVDFNQLILKGPKKSSAATVVEKNVTNKRKKLTTVKFVDFDDLLKGGKQDLKKIKSKDSVKQNNDLLKADVKKVKSKDSVRQNEDIKCEEKTLIPKDTILKGPEVKFTLEKNKKPINHKNFANRVVASLPQGATITDLIKSYLKEKQKTIKSPYLHNLEEKMTKDNLQLEDVNLDEEVKRLDKQIEEIEQQEKLWKEVKEASFKENSFYSPKLEDLKIKYEKYKNYSEEQFKSNVEKMKEVVDNKIQNKIQRLEFLRDSVALNIKNVKSKVLEEEEKIFNLTENGSNWDTMVLLKAITKSK